MRLEDKREFQDYASSGEIDEIRIGGTADDDRAATLGDVKTSKATIKAIAAGIVPVVPAEWVVIPFSTIAVQRGLISAIVDVGHYISIGQDSFYEVRGGINCEFAANEELLLQLFVNGIAEEPPALQLQGDGVNKGVSAFWNTTIELELNDVVELKVSSNTTPFDLTILNSILEIKEDR